MRIRKHAKISSLLYDETSSSSKPGTAAAAVHHVCKLNQSPWDVLTFFEEQTPPPPPLPPLLYKVDEDNDSSLINGWSFPDSIGADHKAPLIKSEVGADDNVGIIPPSSENGGKGGQCWKKVCEHNNPSSSSQVAAKKSGKAALESNNRRRPRQKKATGTLSSNPYEYYYYSGFGPRWAKRRDSASTKAAEPNSNSGTTGSSDIFKNDLELVEPNTPSAENNYPFSEMDIEERFDYIEDDEDEDEIGQSEKKRIRKPIKARSLKSLM